MRPINQLILQSPCFRKLECFNHALVDKRQSGVVAHLGLCASALLRHGRTFLFPADPNDKTLTKFGTIFESILVCGPVSWDTDATRVIWLKVCEKKSPHTFMVADLLL